MTTLRKALAFAAVAVVAVGSIGLSSTSAEAQGWQGRGPRIGAVGPRMGVAPRAGRLAVAPRAYGAPVYRRRGINPGLGAGIGIAAGVLAAGALAAAATPSYAQPVYAEPVYDEPVYYARRCHIRKQWVWDDWAGGYVRQRVRVCN